jgi:hypothetical protein
MLCLCGNKRVNAQSITTITRLSKESKQGWLYGKRLEAQQRHKVAQRKNAAFIGGLITDANASASVPLGYNIRLLL